MEKTLADGLGFGRNRQILNIYKMGDTDTDLASRYCNFLIL